MLTALDASPRALERPMCRGWIGDRQISGSDGHIMTDDRGFVFYISTESPRRWTGIKKRLLSVADERKPGRLNHWPSQADLRGEFTSDGRRDFRDSRKMLRARKKSREWGAKEREQESASSD